MTLTINNAKPLNFTPQDVLASLGFEAQRIANSVAQHSAGAPFPDPNALQAVLDRMNELNFALKTSVEQFKQKQGAAAQKPVLITN